MEKRKRRDLCIILLPIILLLTYINSISSLAANNPIAENDLGLAARACAQNYCKSKDSLQLWLDIEFICAGQYVEESMTPAYASRVDKLMEFRSTPSSSSSIFHISKWTVSRHAFGILCSIIALLGLMIGIYIGRKFFGSSDRYGERYSSVPIDEDEFGTFVPEKTITFRSNYE